MVDSLAQIGIMCCEVPASKLDELEGLPAYLVLSSEEGYEAFSING